LHPVAAPLRVGLTQALGGTIMRYRNTATLLSALAVAMLASLLIAGCAHHLGPKMEPKRVARALGLAECDVSEPMRRYQALDFADRLGNPNLADSSEWATAISAIQPGDDLRHVYCPKTGSNFFGVFRGNSVLIKFGSFLF
jgi:hypothetical protein